MEHDLATFCYRELEISERMLRSGLPSLEFCIYWLYADFRLQITYIETNPSYLLQKKPESLKN